MESPHISSLIAERQSPSNRDYFAARASRCFSIATGPSCIEILMKTVSSGASNERDIMKDEVATATPLFPPNSRLIFTSTFKVETDFELRQILNSHHEIACKTFFIRQRNSASRLNISSELFDTLRQECGISERIRDYVPCFGLRNGEAEVGPPAMYHHLQFSEQSELATRFECAYVLRFVEPNHRPTGNPWSIRQTCIYNNFCFKTCFMNWLFIAISVNAEDQLRSWPDCSSWRKFPDPSEVHYLLFDIAIASWRRYIIYLADEIRQQADRAIMAELNVDEIVATRLEERQYLKQIEDNVTDVISALEFMLENIDAMIHFLQEVSSQMNRYSDHDQTISWRASLIDKGMQDRRRDLVRFISQARSLSKKVDSAATLVSNILDLSNGNALKTLALESRAENANMALLTQKSVRDAATVKVLTIVTLVYLPLTVVTNFFSTQFVSSTLTSSGATHLSVIPETWILFATSVPLTILTIYIWWAFAQREVQGKFPGNWRAVVAKTVSIQQRVRRTANTTAPSTENS